MAIQFCGPCGNTLDISPNSTVQCDCCGSMNKTSPETTNDAAITEFGFRGYLAYDQGNMPKMWREGSPIHDPTIKKRR
ncbi:uncharacterized protein TrAtP1_004407 [Trichoderma atroviride]|uniref:uncharacterized protein n=1 Tax=Hypocrea atroviridis TaxID=63577 RepID=UPI003333F914|nr:hypothetical protein TrAtP1_004407 [Trichoderma atroviride]